MAIVKSIILTLILFLIIFLVLGTYYNSAFCAYQYDYQSSETFLGNFSSLAYNVSVLNQSDKLGKGPAYLLNGVTNVGYWYQVGVGYNWSTHGNDHANGFSTISYLEFVTTTNSIPIGNSIHPRDNVLLDMNIENNTVILTIHDWNTNFSKEILFPAFNATYFVGGPYIGGPHNGTSNMQGHFTGLMTEWWHQGIDLSPQSSVVYTPHNTHNGGAQLLVHNAGPIAQPTQNTFGGRMAALACAFDIYNWNKPLLNQTAASSIIKITNSTNYSYSPYENITLQLQGRNFITK